MKRLDLNDVFALVPIAGAEFVGLQSIENAQHFLRIAADAHVGDISKADDAFRIDDEGGALGNAGFFIEHAEGGRKLAVDVGEHREGQVLEVGVIVAPGQVDELAVDRHAVNHGVAILEVAIQLPEAGDFRRADKGEVLRPEEDELPLARIGLLAEVGKGGLGIGGNDALYGKGRKLIANGQHGFSPYWVGQQCLTEPNLEKF